MLTLNQRTPRGVAQLARAPGLGPGGRRFKSCRPDHTKTTDIRWFLLFNPFYNPIDISASFGVEKRARKADES